MSGIKLKTVSDWAGFCCYCLEVLLALCCLSYALVLIVGQKKKKVSDVLVMHLCSCELVTVIFVYCIDCLYFWNVIDFRSDATYIWPIYTALYISVYQSVVLIVVDRVLAVYLVLKYKVFVTKKQIGNRLQYNVVSFHFNRSNKIFYNSKNVVIFGQCNLCHNSLELLLHHNVSL